MTTISGLSSAEALVAIDLPFDAIVEALIREVGLTRAEATRATFAASNEGREVEWAHHVHA